MGFRLSQAGEDERAEAVADRAERLLDNAATPDPELRAKLDLARIGMRLMRGGGYDLERSERAVRLLRSQPHCRCLLVALDAYAGALRSQGRAAESLAIVEEAMQRAPQVPDAGASMFSALTVSRARAEAALGNHEAARAAFQRALEESDRREGADSVTSVLRRHQMARHLIALGRPAEALPLLARARQAVNSWPEQTPARRYQGPETLALEASVWMRRGQTGKALVLLAAAGADHDRAAQSERPHLTAQRHLLRGEALSQIGRDAEAHDQLEAAARLIERHRLAADAWLRVQQAQIRLELRRGDIDAATALTERLAQRALPDHLSTLWMATTRAELALARADCSRSASQAAAALALPGTAPRRNPTRACVCCWAGRWPAVAGWRRLCPCCARRWPTGTKSRTPPSGPMRQRLVWRSLQD